MLISDKKIKLILSGDLIPDDLSDEELGNFCVYANFKYREGQPVISDEDYDFVFLKSLRARNPKHILFKSIEPEGQGFSEEKVLLPQPMLSIDKAYSFDEVVKWTERIIKSADDLNIEYSLLVFNATPKLDGFAGFDDGKTLYTRGDGKKEVI